MSGTYPREIKNNSFYSNVINRVHNNNGNFNIIVDGLPRSGKSRACLKMAWDLDRSSISYRHRFDPKNICFSFQEVLKRVNRLPEKSVGRVIVWEEAGSYMGVNSRSWHSDFNMEASKLFQTMGYRRLILIVNLPHYYMLDKQVRMLIHAKITMEKIDRSKGRSKGRLEIISPHRNEYDIFRTPGVKVGKSGNTNYRTLYFNQPPKNLDSVYSSMERGFKNKWIEDAQKTIADGLIVKPKRIPLFRQLVKIIKDHGMEYNSAKEIFKLKEVQVLNPSAPVLSNALMIAKSSL